MVSPNTKWLTIIIPALNEIENLRVLIPEIHAQTPQYGEIEILVVLPTKSTIEETSELKNLSSKPITRNPSDSFGDAIRSGIANVRESSTHVIFMDADGSHNPKTLPRLIDTSIDGEFDIVIASRYVKGGTTENTFILKTMSKILNNTFALVLGLKIKDISTNYKIFRRDLLNQSKLICNNYDIVEEILLESKKIKPALKLFEIPDHFHERLYGESKRKLSLFIFTYIITLVRLRIHN